MAQAASLDRRHEPVCHPVRFAFSRISTMSLLRRALAINRQTRWHEYGRPASPVKAGLRPPPSAANGLDRACCPALIGPHAFDGGLRLMQEHTTFQPSRKPLTQNI